MLITLTIEMRVFELHLASFPFLFLPINLIVPINYHIRLGNHCLSQINTPLLIKTVNIT